MIDDFIDYIKLLLQSKQIQSRNLSILKEIFIITTPDKTYFLKNRRHPDQISEESYDKNNEYENSLEDG